MRTRAVLLSCLAACGLQEIELAQAPLGGDVLVLDGIPAERVARFALPGADKMEPKLALSYPPSGVALPADVAPFTFVWDGGKMPPPAPEPMPAGPKPKPANDVVYELHLRAAQAELRVYATASRLTLPAERWRRLLDAGSSLAATVRALDAKGAIKIGPQSTLEVRAPLAPGALYYVAETRGVVRASTDAPDYELVSEEATCTGCRPVARDGSVRVVQSEPELVVEALSSRARSTLTSATPLPALDWASLSPDGERLVASGQGQLALYGREPLALQLAGLGYATDPDWGPGAGVLALAADMRPPGMMMMPGMMTMEPAPNAIVRLLMGDADGFTEHATLVESEAPDETLRAPSFSPDGRYLAFARQKGKGEMSALGWVAAEPGGGPATQGVLAMIKAREATPTWLPSSSEREYWLVFSSSLEGPAGKIMPEQAQLWALGVERQPDDSLKPMGEPFWLPCQDPAASNRRALFAPR